MDQPNQHEIDVAGAANIDQPGQDKLNADCWEKVFDCLSFEEIYSMSQTCKRLQRIAGYYVNAYLPAFRGGITFWGAAIFLPQCDITRNGLNEYINELHISYVSNPEFKLNQCLSTESFPSVKKLTLSSVQMNGSQFRYIEGILDNIEALEFESCKINGNLFVQLLQQCPKLKSLRVARLESETHWLHNEFPTLEIFEFESERVVTGSEVVTFLVNNPNIKRLRITTDFIWHNAQAFKEADIQLDCLVIDFNTFWFMPIGPFVRLLEELHGRRFYKSFHIRSGWLTQNSQEFVDSVAPLNTLKALYIQNLSNNICSLVHLKELRCDCIGGIHPDALAKGLVNLEQLYISTAALNDILPFVRHSRKLRKISIDSVGPAHTDHRIDLTALNNERHKLKEDLGGRKLKTLAVYFSDRDYMAAKWHMKNVHLDLIELKRTEMCLRIHSVY